MALCAPEGTNIFFIIKPKQMKAKDFMRFFLCLNFFCFAQQVFAQPAFPGIVVAASPDPASVTIPSPSLAILPDSSYVASHDKTSTTSAIYRSADRGLTWTNIAEVDSSHWSTLFYYDSALYLMGTSRSKGSVTIHRSTDGGYTWTTPVSDLTGLLLPGKYHTAPVPVVHHRERIWRAYEDVDTIDGVEVYGAFMYSASDTADLLHAASWTRTNSIFYDQSWINARVPRWREGNAVIAPDGSIMNFIRFETAPSSTDTWEIQGAAAGFNRYYVAARLQVDSAGTAISFDTTGPGYINFPGPESKFTIRYDSVSGKYWSLVSKITTVHTGTSTYNSPYRQRNVVMLVSSPDLTTWTEHCKVLRWNEGAVLNDDDKFGFQYWDWQFEGNDIVAVSRTGWYGRNYHDANLMTFHRVQNFRTLTMDDSAEDLLPVTQNYRLLKGWQFSDPSSAGTETSYTSTYDTVGVEASDLVRGAGLIPGGLLRSFNSTFSSYGTPYNIKDSALAKEEYYEFSVAPKAGYELSLSTINARLRRNSNGPTAYAWYYSLDSTTYVQIGEDVSGFTDNNTNGVIQPPVDLSSIPALQSIIGSKIFFRIYAWNVVASTGNLAIGRYGATDTTHSLSVYGNSMALDTTGVLTAWQFSQPSTLGLETYYAATTNDARLEQSTLSRGAGLKPTTFNRSFISLLTSYTAPGNTKTAALANDEFYEFTVTPREGNLVSLQSLEAKLRRNGNGCNAYRWSYSINGGSSFTELGSGDVSFTSYTSEGNVQPAIDLSGITELQGIAAGSTVIFRLYGWGAVSSTGNFGFGRYSADSLTNSLLIRGEIEKDAGMMARSKTPVPGKPIPVVPAAGSLQPAALRAYPNPTTGDLTVDITPGLYRQAQLMDAGGHIVGQWNVPGHDLLFRRNIGFLGAGIYILFLSGEKASGFVKIIKR